MTKDLELVFDFSKCGFPKQVSKVACAQDFHLPPGGMYCLHRERSMPFGTLLLRWVRRVSATVGLKGYINFVAILLLGLPVIAFAGNGSGKVKEIRVYEYGGDGVVFFQTEFNSDKAACSTADGGREWAFRVNTEVGKAMYSLLLSAATSGKQVVVGGRNDCADWGDRERPKDVRIHY